MYLLFLCLFPVHVVIVICIFFSFVCNGSWAVRGRTFDVCISLGEKDGGVDVVLALFAYTYIHTYIHTYVCLFPSFASIRHCTGIEILLFIVLYLRNCGFLLPFQPSKFFFQEEFFFFRFFFWEKKKKLQEYRNTDKED